MKVSPYWNLITDALLNCRSACMGWLSRAYLGIDVTSRSISASIDEITNLSRGYLVGHLWQ